MDEKIRRACVVIAEGRTRIQFAGITPREYVVALMYELIAVIETQAEEKDRCFDLVVAEMRELMGYARGKEIDEDKVDGFLREICDKVKSNPGIG